MVSDVTELARDVQMLMDERDIRRLLESYARAADRKDTELKLAMYHEDGYDDHGNWRGLGHDWSQQRASARFKVVWRIFGNLRIELDGDAAYGELYVFMVAQQPDGRPETHFQVLGARFLDTLARRESGWKIAFRRFVVDWTAVWDSQELHDPPHSAFNHGSSWPTDRVYQVAETPEEWLAEPEKFGYVRGAGKKEETR